MHRRTTTTTESEHGPPQQTAATARSALAAKIRTQDAVGLLIIEIGQGKQLVNKKGLSGCGQQGAPPRRGGRTAAHLEYEYYHG